jgi:hypothetical protein
MCLTINKLYIKINKFINATKVIFLLLIIITFFIINNLINDNNYEIKNLNENIKKSKFNKLFKNEIKRIFNKFNKVNLNEIESKIISKENLIIDKNIKNIINIGFTMDPQYILETMLTVSSIMVTQYSTTKIIFHFGVVNNFISDDMIKIYELKKKINNLTEFNFYYLKNAMKKMKNFHIKGEACPGKFELPELLPNNVHRLIIFDGGDVIVLRDLSQLYNYDMESNWVLGPPEQLGIWSLNKFHKKKKYVNIGSILLNVDELKRNKFWDKYTKNRNLKLFGAPDQTLFNILVPDNKIGYFPLRFGGFVMIDSDKNFDDFMNNSLIFPQNITDEIKLITQYSNPLFIHQFYGKWSSGLGLSIYRNLVKYFMKISGIWEDLCSKKPGYCK